MKHWYRDAWKKNCRNRLPNLNSQWFIPWTEDVRMKGGECSNDSVRSRVFDPFGVHVRLMASRTRFLLHDICSHYPWIIYFLIVSTEKLYHFLAFVVPLTNTHDQFARYMRSSSVATIVCIFSTYRYSIDFSERVQNSTLWFVLDALRYAFDFVHRNVGKRILQRILLIK